VDAGCKAPLRLFWDAGVGVLAVARWADTTGSLTTDGDGMLMAGDALLATPRSGAGFDFSWPATWPRLAGFSGLVGFTAFSGVVSSGESPASLPRLTTISSIT
jgi:hypothetical protein